VQSFPSEIDLARLASVIGNLSRITITHRRWITERQERLAKLQSDAAGKIATMETAGGLSPSAAQAIRAILLSLDPFTPSTAAQPTPDPRPAPNR